jgi:general secretion pathway protein A
VYKRFFGLKKNPFNVNPDPAYLYLTPAMRQALDELTYGIETRKGLVLLTGEAGTGKTTLLNHLLLWLGHQRAKTAFIFNSHVDSRQLFDFILSDFDIPTADQAKANPLLAFNEWLLARYRAHDLVVLIVDEAQGLPVHVLEEIRLLLNMETPNEKLLQIVLAGQPELETKLKRSDLRQLHQRIALRCKTAPLTLQETNGYIEDRLHTAGARDAALFMPEAVDAIYAYSRGIPRVINLLCETALINAYVDQRRTIPSAFIDEAACELQFDDLRPVAPRLRSIRKAEDHTDLHSVLARIQEDAEAVRAWQEKSSLYLVSAQNTSVHDQGANFDSEETSDSNLRSLNYPDSGDLLAGGPSSASQPNIMRPRAQNFGKFYSASLAAARVAIQSLQLHFRMEAVRESFRALRLNSSAREFDGRARNGGAPALVRFSDMLGPRFKARATDVQHAIGNGVAWVQAWRTRNFCEETYGKSFLATAAAAAVLYLFARRIDPAQGWQHPGQMIMGFAGFLLCALSVSLGVAILVRARHKLRADSSEAATNAVRWLRAPIYPMQMRELESLSSKIHTERRAS